MTTTQLEEFKSILQAKQAQLTGALRNRDEIIIEKAPDTLDELQMANDRELAIRTLALDSTMSKQIRNALDRVADGSFGICVNCEEDISPKRIKALPWATFCISCQDEMDHQNADTRGELSMVAYR
jgi:DnaK suppressor protein